MEAVFEVFGGEAGLGVGVEVGAACGHLLEFGVGAAAGEIAEAEVVAVEEEGDVAFGGEGEVAAKEVYACGRGGGLGGAEAVRGRGRAGALRRLAQRRIFPRDFMGFEVCRRCCFQRGVPVFFGAARMFTASLAVAKSPSS